MYKKIFKYLTFSDNKLKKKEYSKTIIQEILFKL